MGKAEARCRHCDAPIIRAGDGNWAHVAGRASVLYRCDPAKSGKPYGLDAEPPSTSQAESAGD